MKKLFLFISVSLLLTTKSNAQRHFIYQHEVGANIGISNSQSDYVAKGPFDGKATINGFALEGAHYLHILPRRYGGSKLLRHTVLKTSLAINLSSFDNSSYGTENIPLSDPPENTPNEVLLGKLSSKTLLISFDNELQIYFKDVIRYLHKYNRYRSKSRTNPYIALGIGINYVNATPTYNAKDGNGNTIYPDNYDASMIADTSTIAISGNFAFGARYKAGTNYDLLAQMGFKYFLSDWIDGVNPEKGNEINDFNTVISIGIVYHMF